MSTWAEVRPVWIKRVNNKALLSVIAEVAAQTDESVAISDATALVMQARRVQSILWLASRGAQGKEWGHAGPTVMKYLSERGKKDD